MEGGPVQVFEGRSRNSFIFHCGDGLHYNVREIRRSRVRLQCRHYKHLGGGCQGTASVSLITGVLHHLQPHNHEPDPLLHADMQLRQAMIREAQTNIFGRTIRSIISDFKLSAQNFPLARRFTAVRMASALYTARNQQYPSIPETLLYLGVLLGLPNTKRLCTTVDGTDFIFQGVVGCQIDKTVALVFVSGRMIQFLETLENIHVDGTFKKRSKKPKMSQILNITTNFGNSVVAVARILMSRRTEVAYTVVFNHLKLLAPSLAPRRVHSDFERGLVNALKAAFPMSRVVGCLWHYGVAFSSQGRILGLAPLARRHEEVHSFIRCLAGAPLLPQHLIWSGVVQIWQEIELTVWRSDFLPLFKYFEREWKPRLAELSVFGVPERTNNCSESDNRSLANVIPQNRPNIWHLIGSFVKLEHLAFCDKVAIENGQAVSGVRRWKAILNDNRVRRLSALLTARQITEGQFLHRVSYAILAAVNHGLHIHEDPDDTDSD